VTVLHQIYPARLSSLMSLELTYDSDLTSDESSPDTVRPR
jgi:hypothetical protein